MITFQEAAQDVLLPERGSHVGEGSGGGHLWVPWANFAIHPRLGIPWGKNQPGPYLSPPGHQAQSGHLRLVVHTRRLAHFMPPLVDPRLFIPVVGYEQK